MINRGSRRYISRNVEKKAIIAISSRGSGRSEFFYAPRKSKRGTMFMRYQMEWLRLKTRLQRSASMSSSP